MACTLFGKEDKVAMDIYSLYGDILINKGEYAAGFQIQSELFIAVHSFLGKEDLEQLDMIERIARAFFKVKIYPVALKLYTYAYERRKEKSGEWDIKTIKCLSDRAALKAVLNMDDAYSEARQAYEWIWQTKYYSVNTLEAMYISILCTPPSEDNKKLFKEAEMLCDISEAMLGKNHPKTLIFAQAKVFVLKRLKEPARAHRLVEKFIISR